MTNFYNYSIINIIHNTLLLLCSLVAKTKVLANETMSLAKLHNINSMLQFCNMLFPYIGIICFVLKKYFKNIILIIIYKLFDIVIKLKLQKKGIKQTNAKYIKNFPKTNFKSDNGEQH